MLCYLKNAFSVLMIDQLVMITDKVMLLQIVKNIKHLLDRGTKYKKI